jgi:IMP dehydrogenase
VSTDRFADQGRIVVNFPMESGSGVDAEAASTANVSEGRPLDVKLVSDVMEPPAWVCPDHTVKMAFVAMRGFGLDALAVVESGAYLGVVRWFDLIDLKATDTLLGAMWKDAPFITPNATIQEAVEKLVEEKQDWLPVVEDGMLRGMVTARGLLQEAGRSIDPLTGLPWSDSLREWALSKFRSGKEITIVFFDLDDFGQFNKSFGHLVGDRVLRTVAETLEQGVDREQDFLCRYGGDEFAVASLRGADGSRALAQSLERDVSLLSPPSGEADLSISWGAWGGKRTREREDVHYASTLDNLINLASRQCQAMKDEKKAAREPVPEPEEPEEIEQTGQGLKLRSLNVSEEAEMSRASVEMLAGSTPVSATFSAAQSEHPKLKVVAQAVADAISHALPADTTLVVHDASVNESPDGGAYASVLATLYAPTHMTEIQGSYAVQSDPNRAVAMAMIRAAEQDIAALIDRNSNPEGDAP